MLASLCTTFQRRAEWTDNVIRAGYSTQLGVLEETLTDIHLLEFASAHPGHLWTQKFTKKQESSLSGADWLWCIGRPGSWLMLAIQAKIVKPATGRCHYLDYRGGDQRRRLTHYAARIGAVPLYCIYGHVDRVQVPNAPPVGRQQWACAFLTPRAVQYAVDRLRTREHDHLLRMAVPWMLPFCEGARLTGNAPGGPTAPPFTGLDVARGLAEAFHRRFRVAEGRELLVQPRNPLKLVSSRFPPPVAALLSGYSGPARRPRPAAVSVVASINLSEWMEGYQSMHTPKQRFEFLTERLSGTMRVSQ